MSLASLKSTSSWSPRRLFLETVKGPVPFARMQVVSHSYNSPPCGKLCEGICKTVEEEGERQLYKP